ncbi:MULTISPECIES: hypothetical protein [unclassified Mycolicibacterium]
MRGRDVEARLRHRRLRLGENVCGCAGTERTSPDCSFDEFSITNRITSVAIDAKTMAIADHLVLRIFGSARSPDVSWPGG